MRDGIEEGDIRISERIPGLPNPADIFTKNCDPKIRNIVHQIVMTG